MKSETRAMVLKIIIYTTLILGLISALVVYSVASVSATSAYTEETKKITEACNKYFAEAIQRDGRGTVSIGDVRALFMLDKLKCDIPARVSGAYPQP